MDINEFNRQSLMGFAQHLANAHNLRPAVNYNFVNSVDSPRVLTVTIQASPSTLSIFDNQFQEELNMAMRLPATTKIRIGRGDYGTLCLEIPKPPALCFFIKQRMLPHSYKNRVCVGVDLNRDPRYLDFRQPTETHVLISGQTGSGKTYLQRSIAISLLKHHHMVIIDVAKKGIQWNELNGAENLLHPVITNEGDAGAMLQYLDGELNRRITMRDNTPRLFVMIDELAALSMTGNTHYLQRLATMGREPGMHLIANTQYPKVANIGDSTIVEQFGVRLLGRMSSAKAAHTASGIAETGAEKLTGDGDFIKASKGGELVRFQAPIPDSSMVSKAETPGHLDIVPLDYTPKGPGRPPKPINYYLVAQIMAIAVRNRGLPASNNTLGSWLKPKRVGAGRTERHRKIASKILRLLDTEGFKLCEK